MMTIERIGEGLARRIDRRRFLRRSAAAIFGAAAVWAAQGIRVPGASAQAGVCYVDRYDICSCRPLTGWYCNDWDFRYCNGALCSGGCGYNNSVYPQACWCSRGCPPGQGYTECCDCDCIDPAGNPHACTCGQYIP